MTGRGGDFSAMATPLADTPGGSKASKSYRQTDRINEMTEIMVAVSGMVYNGKEN